MCYILYGEPNLAWFVEPFYIYEDNYDEFFQWIDTWPEAYAQRMHDGRVMILPADSELEAASYNGEYVVDLPEYRCGPDYHVDPDDFGSHYEYLDFLEEKRGEWYIPAEQENAPVGQTFLHELSWRVAVHETCVVKLLGADGMGEPIAYAYGIVGGEAQPQDRIVEMDLNEIYSKAAELEGARLMVGYHPEALAAE